MRKIIMGDITLKHAIQLDKIESRLREIERQLETLKKRCIIHRRV